MAVEWYCQLMGSELGPLTAAELIQMVRRHQVTPEDLVRRGDSHWVPAYQVQGLFEAAARPAPPEEEPGGESHEAGVRAAETAADAMAGSRFETSPPTEFKSESSAATSSAAASAVPHNSTAADPASYKMSDWYCICEGRKLGPLSFEQLQGIAMSGKLHRQDRVWRTSAPKWLAAGSIEGLNVITE